MSTTAYVALGSNLGDRGQFLEEATHLLEQTPGISVLARAGVYETAPVGGPPGQEKYLNSVVKIQTDLSARELFATMTDIERKLGRVRTVKDAPRTIDLDLLLFGNETVNEDDLVVPHPRMHQRQFVLEPLVEIAPDVVHPNLGLDAKTLLASLGARKPWDLRGQKAVVTGSTSGIGRAIAFALARAGADVIVHGRREQTAKHVVAKLEQLGAKTTTITADLNSTDEVMRFVDDAWEVWDGVTIWINNAGADTLTGEAATWPFLKKLRTLIDVDVIATMLLSREIGRRMQECGQGVILNMGWDQAETGMEGDSGELFSATKSAIMAFSRSLALSLAPQVRVNCLAPGWIQTAWGDQASQYWQDRVRRETPLDRWGVPEDVANTALWLVSPEASFITGQIIRINGGAVR
ncbi:MAG: 2-amino-4-hydroxy-6-hydroxymethyldihydropteridine diphosphokinase [Gemmataceae bacterium]